MVKWSDSDTTIRTPRKLSDYTALLCTSNPHRLVQVALQPTHYRLTIFLYITLTLTMIENLEIKNYRGISNLEISDLSTINIFVGMNGVGKTSILEAIALIVGTRARMFEYLGHQRDMHAPGPLVSSLFRNQKTDVTPTLYTSNGEFTQTVKISPISANEAYSMYSSHRTDKDRLNRAQREIDTAIPGIEISYTNNLDASVTSKYAVHNDHFHIEEESVNNKEGGVFYISTRKGSSAHESAAMFSRLQNAEREDDLYNMLQSVAPGLKRLRNVVLENSYPEIYADFDGQKGGVPVSLIGDGFNRLLLIITGLFSKHSPYLIVDDIDSGFHHSIMEDAWRTLYKVATERKKQVFCVTHNEEMLNATLSGLDDSAKLRIFRIHKEKDRTQSTDATFKAVKYNYKDFKNSVDYDISVR